MKTYKAIIFDMDGVLFDTEGFYYSRRETFLAGKGISIDHLSPRFFIGGNMKKVWENILGEDYDKWDVPALQKEYVQYKKDHPLPYVDLIFSDAKETLASLHSQGYRLGLASSSTMADIERALSETGLREYFSFVLSGDDFVESKPNPAIYREGINQMNLPSESILVVEDSEKGIAAAVAAGLDVWAISDTRFGMEQGAATKIIANLSELLSKFSLSASH